MSQFFSAGLFGSAIPDSAVHRWKFDEGTGTTFSDSIGSADGTRNGFAWISDTWQGGNAGDGDGMDDYGDVGTLGSWGSGLANNFAVGLTVQTTESNNAFWIGNVEPDEGTFFFVMINELSNDVVEFRLRDEGGNSIEVSGSTVVNDGSKYRILCNKTANSASGMEIHVNGSEDSTTVQSDQDFSNPADFSDSLYFFAFNDTLGDAGSNIDSVIDDVIFYGDSLSGQGIQNDYDNQPWS